jgi:homoserine/homoserine lactone efflux protein
MESYILFLIVATITILSPGPGVILTLTNSIRYGVSGAVSGIFGIAIGTFIVAAVSASSLGVILATSSLAFIVMKYIGAIYLIYLGIKLWRSASITVIATKLTQKNKGLQFVEGFTLQVTNPKAVFFFMSVFPQFIKISSESIGQFVTLVIIYSSLVVVIHILYASLAKSARTWLTSEKGGHILNRLGGGTFVLFGIGLASATK